MSSKAVLTRQRSFKAVVKSIDTNAKLVGGSLDTILSPFNTKPVVSTFEALLSLFGALLAKAGADMISADEADIQEGLDDAEPIKRRDQEAQSLYEKIVSLRRTVTGVFGDAVTKSLGISGELSRDPLTLSGLASDISTAAGKLSTPAPLVEGASVDLKTAAASLTKTSANLDVALSDVAREVREGQQSLSKKNAAILHYDNTFSRIVPIVENLYRLAGFKDLADKIRPSSRRPGVIEEEPEASDNDTSA